MSGSDLVGLTGEDAVGAPPNTPNEDHVVDEVARIELVALVSRKDNLGVECVE